MPTPLGAIALTPLAFEAARQHAAQLEYPVQGVEAQDSQLPKLVDADRIAQMFGLEPSWFLTRARENRLPHVRLGKYVRFDPSEIREHFQRGGE
jgi:predicted DNA-binding transcriptional regulator AlpA